MPRIPGYRLHTQSGQAYVNLNGKQHLLGPHGTSESQAKYARLLAEHATGTHAGTRPHAGPDFSIAEMLKAFWKHAEAYHKPEERLGFKYAIRLLRHLYGNTAAADFGPKSLKALREQMIRPLQWQDPDSGENYSHAGWCRNYANHQTNRIKHVFKWATAEQLIPPSVYHGLLAVDGLRRSKTTARESEPVQPAPEPMIAQVLDFLPKPVRAMVELESICGARGGELCIMRAVDIDMSNPECWVYRPTTHKTAHHGHEREVPLGRRCQAIIRPFLKPNPLAFLFSPIDAEASRRAEMAKARVTPTDKGKLYGLEAAGVVLGQRTMAATMIYVEQDKELAAKVMGEIG